MELLPLLVVLACVYVSDALWWTGERSVMLTGRRRGEFKAHCGPTLAIRGSRGFFVSTLAPPFTYAFELDLDAEPSARKTDRASVERAADEVLRLAAPLRRLGEGLWVFLFFFTPIVVAVVGLLRTWMPLLAILLLWLTAIVVLYRRAWRTLHKGDASGWKSDVMLMIVSPPGAIRAADRLTRHALRPFGALRVTSVVAASDEWLRLARLVYFDEAAAHEKARREIEAILRPHGIQMALATPPAQVPGMRGFCPRCHEQVLRDSGDCPDCVGVPIRAFASANTEVQCEC
jgi:hypothetical protein